MSNSYTKNGGLLVIEPINSVAYLREMIPVADTQQLVGIMKQVTADVCLYLLKDYREIITIIFNRMEALIDGLPPA